MLKNLKIHEIEKKCKFEVDKSRVEEKKYYYFFLKTENLMAGGSVNLRNKSCIKEYDRNVILCQNSYEDYYRCMYGKPEQLTVCK